MSELAQGCKPSRRLTPVRKVLSLPTSTRAQPFQCATTRCVTGPGLGSPQSAWILLSGFVPLPTFDVIISNPPKHAKEPRDLADRGWHAGPNHRDVAALFTEAYERLMPGGRLYAMFSSDSELGLIDTLIERAGFRSRVVKQYSIFIESFVLYERVR